jgi:hypothetical protein
MRADPFPYGLALLGLGTGTLLLTVLSLAEDNVTYARTEWTALLAMLLAAPASVLFALGAPRSDAAWRAFWTAGLLAYLMHTWWAVARTYHGDLGAIIDRQGWVAFANAAVTLLWIADVAMAWWRGAPERVATVLRWITWAAVTASFVVASAVFKSGVVAALGDLYAAAVLVALAFRAIRLAKQILG